MIAYKKYFECNFDGSYYPETDRGGWGYVVSEKRGEFDFHWCNYGSKSKTSVPEMELSGLLNLLIELDRDYYNNSDILIQGDNDYICKSIVDKGNGCLTIIGLKNINFTGWIKKWMINTNSDGEWLKSDGKVVAHCGLWKKIVSILSKLVKDRKCRITVKWIPRSENESADLLSKYGSNRVKKLGEQ